MTMPAETQDIDQAIASFRAGVASASGEGLTPRGWSAEDWRELFRFTDIRRIGAADVLIRRGDPDCTLYFVLHGNLEVVIHSGDGISMGPLTRVGAGSVLGEQSFFDGNPRSASVWAVVESEVAAMTPAAVRGLHRCEAGARPRTPVCARPDSCGPPPTNDGEGDELGRSRSSSNEITDVIMVAVSDWARLLCSLLLVYVNVRFGSLADV